MSALRRTRTPPPGSRTAGGPAPAGASGRKRPGKPAARRSPHRSSAAGRPGFRVRPPGWQGADRERLAFPGAARPWVRDDGRSAPPAASSPAPAGPATAGRGPGLPARGTGKRGKVRRTRCAAGRGWRAARPCRRGRPAGAGAGSRAVTDGAAPPLPGVEAAGPGAGRRGGLACRPGPQASTLHSGRPVKSPGAPGLTPGPKRRVDTSLYPPRQEGSALGEGRPPGGYREGARWRAPRRCAPPSRHRPPPGSPVRACPAARSALC